MKNENIIARKFDYEDCTDGQHISIIFFSTLWYEWTFL